jgi:hypothetical protein
MVLNRACGVNPLFSTCLFIALFVLTVVILDADEANETLFGG